MDINAMNEIINSIEKAKIEKEAKENKVHKNIEKIANNSEIEISLLKEQLEESRKHTIILIESHGLLIKANKELEAQNSKHEKTLILLKEQFEFLKNEAIQGDKDNNFSNTLNVISTIFSGISLFK